MVASFKKKKFLSTAAEASCSDPASVSPSICVGRSRRMWVEARGGILVSSASVLDFGQPGILSKVSAASQRKTGEYIS